MSRHRHIRNIDIDDELLEDEDRDYFGKSLEDEVPMSPSTSQFIYHRSRVSSQVAADFPIPEEHEGHDDSYGDSEDDREIFDMDDVSFKPAKKAVAKTKPAPKQPAKPVIKPPIQVEPPKQKPGPVPQIAKPKLPQLENLKVSESKKIRASSKSPARQTALEVALSAPLSYKQRERPESNKDMINLVIAGHVDAGKSTMVGHLLYLLGHVDEKAMRGYKQQSARSGKASFAFAWILDETQEERERGVTMDIAHANFETPHRKFNILDAPGHCDFIPNMISGASQADAALLVVNAARGEFESGFDLGGQTREHALLLRSLGVNQIIVALNKMDTIDWDETRFVEIKETLSLFLKKQAGFSNLTFIPVSGLEGINLIKKPDNIPELTWYKGKCLADVLDELDPPPRLEDKPMRVIINDVLKANPTSLVLQGKVESGFVETGSKVFIMPNCEAATVKSVNSSDKGAAHQQFTVALSEICYAGEHILLTLSGTFEPGAINPGSVICRGGEELLIPAKILVVKLVLFETALPLLKGSKAEMHSHALRVPCTVLKLRSIVNKQTGEIIKTNPRVITKGMSAVVELVVENPIPVEPFAKSRTLGRVSLRVNGKTIGAGIVDQTSK